MTKSTDNPTFIVESLKNICKCTKTSPLEERPLTKFAKAKMISL